MAQRDSCYLVSNEDWVLFREALFTGVTGSQVSLAATKSGLGSVIAEDLADIPEPEQHGWFNFWHKTNLGLFRNNWLVRHPRFHHYLAFPDFISRNGKLIGKFVVTRDPWNQIEAIPDKLFREIQWELFVTGAEYCALTWVEGIAEDGNLRHKQAVPEVSLVTPDSGKIAKLMDVADQLWGAVVGPRIRAGKRIYFASFMSILRWMKQPHDLALKLSWTVRGGVQGGMGPWNWKPMGTEMWEKDTETGEIIHLMVLLNEGDTSYTVQEIGTFDSVDEIPAGMVEFSPVANDMNLVLAHTRSSRPNFYRAK